MSYIESLQYMRWLQLIILPLLITACMPAMEFQSHDLRASGKIYLPLPEGITEGGSESSESKTSSEYLAERLAYHIEEQTEFTVTLDNVYLPPEKLAKQKEVALASAEAAGADYAMSVKLGEYLNAGSMSFRADSLTVKALRIYDVDSGELAFGLKRPYAKSTSNMTSLKTALDSLAREIARNIAKASDE